jgi:hypothetical protein
LRGPDWRLQNDRGEAVVELSGSVSEGFADAMRGIIFGASGLVSLRKPN